MAALMKPDAEVSFTDAEGDKIRLMAQVQGTRGRVALHHNGQFFKYVDKVVHTTSENKVYINGHEAVIELLPDSEGTVKEIEQVCKTGMISYLAAETIDAAAELARVREAELEAVAEELEDLSPEMRAKALEKLKKKLATPEGEKKRVPKASLDKLLEMGIPEARAVRALVLCDGTTPEVAISWLEAHASDVNIDTPIDPSRHPEWILPLTAEQKAAKAKELQDLAERKKKERLSQEKAQQIALEKKRRNEGASVQEAKEEYERKKRMEAYEQMRREKEKDRKAKEAAVAKINAERAAKGWAPLPGSEEEKAGPKVSAKEFFTKQEQGQQQQKPPAQTDEWNPMKFAASEQPAGPPPKRQLPSGAGLPVPGLNLTEEALAKAVAIVRGTPASTKLLKTCVGNIISDPFNPKYRSIKATSNAFKRNIADVSGAIDVLLLAGFRPDKDSDFMKLSVVHLPTLTILFGILNNEG